jgi:hypothetical protein
MQRGFLVMFVGDTLSFIRRVSFQICVGMQELVGTETQKTLEPSSMTPKLLDSNSSCVFVLKTHHVR